MAQRFSFRQRPRRGRYFVYVVVVPANWEPIGWHDRPKLAQEVELAGCFSRRMTRGLMQDFNRSELDARRRRAGKNLWMIADAVEGVELAGCFSRRMTRGLMQDFNRSELDARRRRNGKNLWMIADAVEGGVA